MAGLHVSQPPHIIVDAGRRFAVYSDEFIAVPPRQIGIAGPVGTEVLLKALSLYLSSDFVTYQQFLTTSEWGIKIPRATLEALKYLPIPLDNLSEKELIAWAELRDSLAEMSGNTSEPRLGTRIARPPERVLDKIKELNDKVFHILGLRESERILIQDFVAMNMQCVEGKVPKEVLARPSESTMRVYLERLQKELDTFIAVESEMQHEISACYDTRSAMIAIRLPQTGSPQSPTLRADDKKISQEFAKISERLQQRHSQWIYFKRNLRIYDHDTLYCFKPMQALHWTQRQAILDAGEVIAEILAAEEK